MQDATIKQIRALKRELVKLKAEVRAIKKVLKDVTKTVDLGILKVRT